jgi:glycosyltransferase involved in cell wall biosynthesis
MRGSLDDLRPDGHARRRSDGTAPVVKILYLVATPPPVVPGTDAVVQEVDLLRAHFGGEAMYLRPAWRGRGWYPRELLGLHRLRAIRYWDSRIDLHHVYAPQLLRLPLLRLVTRPVVYTVTSGLGPASRWPRGADARRLRAIGVPGRADLGALTAHGLTNVRLMPPGIDVARFLDAPVPPGPEFVLLAGSAPWARQQFETKGVDALLEAARVLPDLRLVFLWRGVLLADMLARVARLGLSGRVEILRERVDVSQVLTQVHAAVVLAAGPGLVKAYPHSLLEALAAGRPVLISAGNPMADYVRARECGRVVPRVDSATVVEAIQELRRRYGVYRARASEVDTREFSKEGLVAAYGDLYRSAIG